jgi:diguanylate cyclase (GGDEF)-like protein/PAS domain S-box-containing protein
MIGKFPPFPGVPSLPRGRRLVAIVWLFAGIVACLLIAAVFSLGVLSAGRAFVEAEGHWTRAQKEAVYHLTRYALVRDEADYAAFNRAVAVPKGDRRARIELLKPEPDYELARAGFLEARNHPSDVEPMITLFRWLKDFSPVDRAVSLWSRADTHVDELLEVAREIHGNAAADSAVVAGQLARINRINSVLTPLEDQIAAMLNAAQRAAQAALLAGMLLLAGSLLVAGITIAKRFVLQNERLQRTLRDSEGQLRHLIESAPLPLLILRASDLGLLYANDRALQQFGLDMDSVRGRTLGEFHVDAGVRDTLGVALRAEGAVRDYEVHMKDRAGREFWLLLSAQRLHYAGEDCLLAALANIDDRKRLQEDMRRRAMHDPLTTLPNRAMFLEALERAIRKARRRSARFSVLFIDLDRFKEVNDTLGHHAGDELLQTMAERLGSAVRQSDLVARMGGDEFVVLIEEHRGPEEVMIVAQKILSMLERPVLLDWREVSISGSVGIASFPDDGTDVESLVKNADTAMYQAKERGRNNFQFYSEDLNKLTLQRFEMEKRVRGALEREEFFLQYQPEVDLATGRVTSVEALLRWRDPDAGLVNPGDFLPHAEETGAILAVGKWVLERALADLASWRQQGFDFTLSLNLSARQLQDPDLVNEVFQALQSHHVAARNLRLEMTEATLLRDPTASERTLRALRGLGVELVLDDFGVGNSSLGLLRRFPLQSVKIDRALVATSPQKRDSTAVIQAVVAMARTLELTVVAEGVENEEQRRQVMSLGCNAAQGFLYGKPVEAAKVPRLVDERPTISAPQ